MSLSAILPASLLDSSLLRSLTSSATATPISSAAATTASSNPVDAVTQDLAALLKALSSGDTTGSKADFAKLKSDLKAEQASIATASSSSSSASASASSDPLNTLLSSMSTALGQGDTSGALSNLASYLVQTGQSTGMLLNTSA